jgi:hypothetical protein
MDRLIRSIDQLLDGQNHATKGDAKPSGQVEQLTDNNRAPFTLLGNTKGGPAQRRKLEEMSTTAPIIREMMGNASAWPVRQANIWLQVVKNPKEFVSSIDLASTGEVGNSVQFLCFVVLCNAVLSVPIDALQLHLNVFNPINQITNAITSVLESILFGSAIWFFGRAIRGRGQYRCALIAGFYATAFFLIFNIPDYVTGKDSRKIVSGSFVVGADVDPVKSWIAVIVSACILIYVTIKLIPLIKFIHSIGTFRASLVYCATVAASTSFEYYIGQPFTAQMINAASTK